MIVRHRGETHTFATAEKLSHSGGGYYSSKTVDGSYEWKSYYATASWDKETYIQNVDCGIAKPLVPYIAFFSDCRHEIKEVVAGVRLTLSFQLLCDETKDALEVQEEDMVKAEPSDVKAGAEVQKEGPSEPTAAAAAIPQAPAIDYERMKLPQLKELSRAYGLKVPGTKPELISRLEEATAAPVANIELIPLQEAQQKAKIFSTTLKEGLQSSNFFSEGEMIGFACFHLYEREAELPRDLLLTKNVRASNLKLRGADAPLELA